MRAVPFILRLGPRLHGAFVERQPGVRNHQVHIVIDGVPEALAARASAHGVVETEEARLGRRQLNPAALAREFFAESPRGGRRILRRGFLENHLAGFAITDFRGVHDALVQLRRNNEPVH